MKDIIPTRQPAVFRFDPALLSEWGCIQDNYRYHVKEFLKFAAVTPGENGLEIVKEYFKQLNKSRLSASTIRCKRQAVKSRLRLSISSAHYSNRDRAILENELRNIESTPGMKCPTPSQPDNSGKTISPKEYDLLLKKARSQRQKRFIEFLYNTGARVSEMCGVLISDCKESDDYVTVILRGKGTRTAEYKERRVYLSVSMYWRIRGTFEGETYLFETQKGKHYNRCYVSNQLASLTLVILGRKLSAHKFRHSTITRLIGEGKPIDAVSRYAGHSSVQITMRYSHNRLSPSDVLGGAI